MLSLFLFCNLLFFSCDKPHYPYELPEGWTWCRLNEIAESSLGKTLDKSKNTGKEYYYLCAMNVKWGNFDFSFIKKIRLEDSEKERYQVVKGDLLICEGGDVGRSAIWNIDEPIYYQNALHRVRFFSGIVAEFYLYLIWCYKNYNWIDDICNGVTIKHFTQDKLNALYFPLPPVSEQQRIVMEIKRWLNLIDKIEQGKQDLQDTIKQAKSKILDLAIHGKLVPQDPTDEPAAELLKRINPKAEITCDNPRYRKLPKGWAVTTIKDMCENINGLWKGKKEPFVNVGVIRNANFTKDFKLDYSKIEYIDVEQRAFNQRHLNNGDLIVEKSGGSDNNPVGRAILYEGKDAAFSFSNFTMVLRIKEKGILTSRYLFYFLLAEYQKGSMRLMQTQTTGLHNLILDKYLSMPILLPPFSEQLRITAKIEELFDITDVIKASL